MNLSLSRPIPSTLFLLSLAFLRSRSGSDLHGHKPRHAGRLFSSGATGIHASSEITGFAAIHTSDGATINHAFLYSGGTMTDLGTLGGKASSGAGINASGQVAGSSTNCSGDDYGFFTNSTGELTSGGALGGSLGFSEAEAINDSGRKVGAISKAKARPIPFFTAMEP
jgi:probable HAF family extracellular repeat protein